MSLLPLHMSGFMSVTSTLALCSSLRNALDPAEIRLINRRYGSVVLLVTANLMFSLEELVSFLKGQKPSQVAEEWYVAASIKVALP